MNDKELADRVVVLGVLELITVSLARDEYHYMTPNGDVWVTPEAALEDWSVAGALMEKLENELGLYVDLSQLDKRSSTLPRAIIEACVEALKGERR